MSELSLLLQRIETIVETSGDAQLVNMIAQSLLLAEQQTAENRRLKAIISDIRERDSRKNCLCRGMARA